MFTVRAYAKLNLFLHIVGFDGALHEIQSLFVFLDLCDQIVISYSERDIVRFSGFGSDTISSTENSIVSLLRNLRNYVKVDSCFDIHVKKKIPVAGGLGGGSVDAVALIYLFQEIFGFDDSCAKRIASCIGTDALSCFKAKWKPSLVSGTGNIVSQVRMNCPKHVVLVNPGIKVAASFAYSLYEKQFSQSIADLREFDVSLLSEFRNDLQRFVSKEYPIISNVIELLSSLNGCVLFGMSGSGATCFGIFECEHSSIRAAMRASENGWWSKCLSMKLQ